MSEIKRPQSLQGKPNSSVEFGPALDSSGGLGLATATALLALPAAMAVKIKASYEGPNQLKCYFLKV